MKGPLHTGGHGQNDNKQDLHVDRISVEDQRLTVWIMQIRGRNSSSHTHISPTTSQLEPCIKYKYIEAKISRQLKARLTFHLPSRVVCRVGGAAKYPRHIFNR